MWRIEQRLHEWRTWWQKEISGDALCTTGVCRLHKTQSSAAVMCTVQIPSGFSLRQIPYTLGCCTLKTTFPGTPQEPFTILRLCVLELSFPPWKAIPHRFTTGAARDKAAITTHIFIVIFCFVFLSFFFLLLFCLKAGFHTIAHTTEFATIPSLTQSAKRWNYSFMPPGSASIPKWYLNLPSLLSSLSCPSSLLF